MLDAARRDTVSVALGTESRFGGPGADALRDLDRRPTEEVAQIRLKRVDELAEAGEAEVRLVVHAPAPDPTDTACCRPVHDRRRSRRRAEARLAGQHQRRSGDGRVEG